MKVTRLTKTLPDVAFTFDDGPYNYTSDLLDKLLVYNAKATFMISKLKPIVII
jgi:peptidoglycan/xylan/chitin deacetylase (PgdA/CDA1 family)